MKLLLFLLLPLTASAWSAAGWTAPVVRMQGVCDEVFLSGVRGYLQTRDPYFYGRMAAGRQAEEALQPWLWRPAPDAIERFADTLSGTEAGIYFALRIWPGDRVVQGELDALEEIWAAAWGEIRP